MLLLCLFYYQVFLHWLFAQWCESIRDKETAQSEKLHFVIWRVSFLSSREDGAHGRWEGKQNCFLLLLQTLITVHVHLSCYNCRCFLRKSVIQVFAIVYFNSPSLFGGNTSLMKKCVWYLRGTGWQSCIFPLWREHESRAFQDMTKRQRVGYRVVGGKFEHEHVLVSWFYLGWSNSNRTKRSLTRQ